MELVQSRHVLAWFGVAGTITMLAPMRAQAAPLEENGRVYEGPRSVEPAEDPLALDEGTKTPDHAEPRREQAQFELDTRRRSTADGSLPPARFVDVACYPPRGHAAARGLELPRTLRTIDGADLRERAQLYARTRAVSFVPGFQVRTRMGSVSDFAVDENGGRYREGAYVAGRIRWRPVLGVGKRDALQVVGMIDVVNGRWTPRTFEAPIDDVAQNGQPPIPTDIRLIDPRELYVQWTSKYGQLRVGQSSFNWGLGLVSNDGNNLDRFGDMKFGNDGDGSIVERILFATKPLAGLHTTARDLVVALGADLIYRDPNASLVDGDLAGQGLVALRWEPRRSPGAYLGGYIAYRGQRSADDGDTITGDDTLEVIVADVAGRGYRYVRPNLALMGAFEAVTLRGRTTFFRDQRSRHRIVQGALAARGFVGDPKVWLLGADAGWLSGDANPNDDQLNTFQAAPGYTAGLLLFPFYQGWQSARSQRQAEDPNLAGVPPGGTQYIPTQGRVNNVAFVHPKVRYGFMERFEVWGGPLLALSSAKLVDPDAAFLAGGAPTNALGGDVGSRRLGSELDLGLRARYGFREMWMQAGLQGAVLFPGPAFNRADGSRDAPIMGGWLRVELRY